MNKVLFLFSFICFHITLGAQKYKYGNVDAELLMLENCALKPDADAMITYKKGERSVSYSGRDLKAYTKIRVQIKIFNDQAKELATIRHRFYCPKKNKHKKVDIIRLKGTTYNLENGKIVETKLNDESIFNEQFNNFYRVLSIAIPNIRKNTVFEYEYELVSDFVGTIDDWNIQEDYPVLYNEFVSEIPKALDYQTIVQGEVKPVVDEKNVIYQKLVFENVPPLIFEEFVANPEDYRAKIKNQLVSIITDTGMETIAGNYKRINDELLRNLSFGEILKNGDDIDQFINVKNLPNAQEKAIQIHSFFKNNIKHDGAFHFLTDRGIKKLVKDGVGDSGDINLNYIAALRHAGIPTVPVIMSTVGNGTLHRLYAVYSDINHVVALSEIDGKNVLSDATGDIPFGYLPEYCLNGSGWKVDKLNSGWIDLKEGNTGKEVIQTEINLADNLLIYKSKIQRSNYFAFRDYQIMKAKEDNAVLFDLVKEGIFSIDSSKIIDKGENVLKLGQTLKAEVLGEDAIYISPFPYVPYDVSPFTREERHHTVNLPYCYEFKYISIIDIPKSYTFELPEKINASLEDKSINVKYNFSFNEVTKKLTISYDFKVLKTEFPSWEYIQLKSIFELAITKVHEKIVLKKT